MFQREMHCPQCHSTVLRVDVMVSGSGMAVIDFRDDGTQEQVNVTEYELYYKYKTTSEVWCSMCGYTGTVREAQKAARTANRLAHGQASAPVMATAAPPVATTLPSADNTPIEEAIERVANL